MNFTTESWDENNDHHKNRMATHIPIPPSLHFLPALSYQQRQGCLFIFHIGVVISREVLTYYSRPTSAIFILRALRTIISISRLPENQQIPSSLASFHLCHELRGLAASLDTQRAVLLVLFLTDWGATV